MGKPREKSWTYIKSMTRDYPKYKQYGVRNHVQQAEKDAVEAAIRDTLAMPDGESRIQVIDLVYWRKTHTIAGAASVIHYSERTAVQWHGEFLRLVGKHFKCDGLIER